VRCVCYRWRTDTAGFCTSQRYADSHDTASASATHSSLTSLCWCVLDEQGWLLRCCVALRLYPAMAADKHDVQPSLHSLLGFDCACHAATNYRRLRDSLIKLAIWPATQAWQTVHTHAVYLSVQCAFVHCSVLAFTARTTLFCSPHLRGQTDHSSQQLDWNAEQHKRDDDTVLALIVFVTNDRSAAGD